MPDKRIPELDPVPLVDGSLLMAVYDLYTDTTYRMPLSSLGLSVNTEPFWDAGTEYSIDDVIISDNRFWRSLQNMNTGNFPAEDAFWTEVSKEGLTGGLQSYNVDTAPGTINLDLQGAKHALFKGSPAIAAGKIIGFSNDENFIMASFVFELAGTHVLTFGANVVMNDPKFAAGPKTWTPDAAGKYQMHITNNNGEYYVKIYPYSAAGPAGWNVIGDTIITGTATIKLSGFDVIFDSAGGGSVKIGTAANPAPLKFPTAASQDVQFLPLTKSASYSGFKIIGEVNAVVDEPLLTHETDGSKALYSFGVMNPLYANLGAAQHTVAIGTRAALGTGKTRVTSSGVYIGKFAGATSGNHPVGAGIHITHQDAAQTQDIGEESIVIGYNLHARGNNMTIIGKNIVQTNPNDGMIMMGYATLVMSVPTYANSFLCFFGKKAYHSQLTHFGSDQTINVEIKNISLQAANENNSFISYLVTVIGIDVTDADVYRVDVIATGISKGSVGLAGSQTTLHSDNVGAFPAPNVAISGNTIEVSVTGKAATTIRWTVDYRSVQALNA